MEKNEALTKSLARTGTIIVLVPVSSLILTAVVLFIQQGGTSLSVVGVGGFYEEAVWLFPLTLVGGGSLIWAALRAHSRRKLIGWGFGIAVGSLIVSQTLAVVTGVAPGYVGPALAIWQRALAFTSITAFSLAPAVLFVGGVLLRRDLTSLGRFTTDITQKLKPDASDSQPTNSLALISLALGVLGFLGYFLNPLIAFILGVPTIITGLEARKIIRASQGGQQGVKLAIGGLVLGIVDVLLVPLTVAAFAIGCSVSGGFC